MIQFLVTIMACKKPYDSATHVEQELSFHTSNDLVLLSISPYTLKQKSIFHEPGILWMFI